MNILVALNANYVYPLKVMLESLFENNSGESFSIYMMYSKMPAEDLADLDSFILNKGHKFVPLYVEPSIFKEATVVKHFTAEMYYRLIAYHYLPDDLDRILYLDPDIIVLNPVSGFYHKSFNGAWFMASEHQFTTKIVSPFNKMRLKTPKAKGYFNTGVLLMNVRALRKDDSIRKIFAFIKEHRHQLLLPDQDVFNALYWDKIIPVSGAFYNYDARFYGLQKLSLTSSKLGDMDWIKKHTVFVHYCGKQKPWQEAYKGDLGIFFRQYAEHVPLSEKKRESIHSLPDRSANRS
ncbi:glycosyltransferase family 8 protein [Sporolactobacillus sp. THM7-4]|nr:glycosyltransferase family 8 protein [Sporolactobacillus sp. THM7-4]